MAERDLKTLLKTLEVNRRAGIWRYKSMSNRGLGLLRAMSAGRGFGFRSKVLIDEREGVTAIVPAKADTPSDNRWVWLELSVYSDLHAVGFLAAVAAALAEADVPCNAVAGFHHDHIFVPEAKAEIAIKALKALSARS